jgi:DMSO reductase anchor subunit
VAVACGLGGVYTSVMVYAATRRPLWSRPRTGARFFGSVAILGLAAALASGAGRATALTLVVAVVAKLAFELAGLGHRRLDEPLGRSAALVRGPLATVAVARLAAAALGGIVLPLALATAGAGARVACLGLLVAGELLERHLFFVAAPTPRMPGPPA